MKYLRNLLSAAALALLLVPSAASAQIMIDPTTIVATAGSVFDDSGRFDPSNMLDDAYNEGNRDGHLGTHYLAAENTFTETVTFDLGGNYDLVGIRVLNTSNTGWNDSETDRFTIATSSDGGSNYTTPSAEIELQDFTEGFQEVPYSASSVTHVQLVITNDDLDDQGTNDVRVGLNEVQFNAVPEPSSIAFLGVGMLMLLGRRKR